MHHGDTEITEKLFPDRLLRGLARSETSISDFRRRNLNLYATGRLWICVLAHRPQLVGIRIQSQGPGKSLLRVLPHRQSGK